ncbi:MAG: hypothetical protein KBE22_00245 [Candidatus Accumulibacter sp.]|nr:hypothetical protein [Accumulibacter sp.]
MSAFRKGRAVCNAAAVKTIAAAVCAVVPFALALYTGLGEHYDLPVSGAIAGLIATFITGVVGAVSTVITSPQVGLARDETQDSRFFGD